MKKIALFMGAVLLIAFITGAAYAGVEPTPFRTDSLRLENVSLSVVSVDTALENVLANDIRPVLTIATLKVLSKELEVLNDRVNAVLTRLAVVPDDQRLLEALADVRAIANDVMSKAQAGFAIPTNDQRLLNALHEVEMNAQGVINNVDSFLGSGQVPGPALQ